MQHTVGKSHQIIRFTPLHAGIIGTIAVGVGVISTLLDGGDNTYFFNWVFTYINPHGGWFYADAMLFVSVLLALGVYIFVNYIFLRGAGHLKTVARQQQATDLHGYDAEIPEDDKVNDFFANLTSGAGLASMGLMVITNIIGLFLLQGGGIFEHGIIHWDRLVVAIVWNLILSFFFFGMSTLGLIIGFQFLEHAGVRFRRDIRVRDSAGKTMPKPPAQQQEQGQSQQRQIAPPQQQRQTSSDRTLSPGHTSGAPQQIPQQSTATSSRQQAQRFGGRQGPPVPQHAGKLDSTMAPTRRMPPPSQRQQVDTEDDENDWDMQYQGIPQRGNSTRH